MEAKGRARPDGKKKRKDKYFDNDIQKILLWSNFKDFKILFPTWKTLYAASNMIFNLTVIFKYPI